MSTPAHRPSTTPAAPPAQDPLVGLLLHERFRLTERISTSVNASGSVVYKAVQEVLGRPVAVRLFRATRAGVPDGALREWFMRDAAAAAKLRHPGTVMVLDYGEAQGLLFLAMEHVEGVTLAARLRASGPLHWRSAADVAEQVARGLREAHAAGITHRHLSPFNVMLLSDKDRHVVKVMDFGLVRPPLPEGTNPTPTWPFRGSALYMAPEQARADADPRSDLYALGLLLYEMLTGRAPFSGANFVEVLGRHERQPVPPLAQARPGLVVPPALEALVLRLLEKDPAARPQSADEALEALKTAASSARSQTSASGVPTLHPAGGTPSGAHATVRQPTGPMATGTGPMSGPMSGPHTGPGSVSGPVSGPHTGPGSVTGPQQAAAAAPMLASLGAEAQRPSRTGLYAAVGGAVVLLAVGGVLLSRGGGDKAPAQAPAPQQAQPQQAAAPQEAAPAAAPAAPAAPTQVRFVVHSEPSGATVMLDGRVLGQTPHQFEQPVGPEGMASVQLELRKEGYQPAVVISEGAGPVVFVRPTLTRRTGREEKRTVVRYRQPAAPPAARAGAAPAEAEPLPAEPLGLDAPVAMAAPAARKAASTSAPTPAAPAPTLAASPPPSSEAAAPAPEAPKMRTVVRQVLMASVLKQEQPRTNEMFRRANRGLTARGTYRVCVGTDGRVLSVTPVQSIPLLDEDVAKSFREGWLFKPFPSPTCAALPVAIEVK